MSLSKAEEELMGYLWDLESAYMKDIIECYPPPKPAPSTIATLLKRIHSKGFIQYVQEGRSRRYQPIIKKKDYFGKQLSSMISHFFNGSKTQFASFFTEASDLNQQELEALRKIIDRKIQKGQ